MPAASYGPLLYPAPPDDSQAGRRPPADTLRDLNLDQVFASIGAAAPEYDFAVVFECPTADLSVVEHRHAVFRDLEAAEVLQTLKAFVGNAAGVRKQLAQKLYDEMQADRWFLAAVTRHCNAVEEVSEQLAAVTLESAGLRGLRAEFSSYRRSQAFAELREEAARLERALAELRFVVHAHAGKITVAAPGDEEDFAGSVAATFERFASTQPGERAEANRRVHQLDRVETAILHLLGKLHPQLFGAVAAFHQNNVGFIPKWHVTAEHEASFYVHYREFMQTLTPARVHWTLPLVSRTDRTERIVAGCDVALAQHLSAENQHCVANDLELTPPEQILAISGPNQGGKTTTARMFGQLHYLASLGVPVPAREARLFLPDNIYTHFERAESIETLAGKLEDELRRARAILDSMTGESVVIFNETFGSTSLADAYSLGAKILSRVTAAGALGVYVTFVDELTRLDEHVVSMMSTTQAGDDDVRTFKVVRKRADGKVHAAVIARRHHLGYQDVRGSVAS